MKEWKVSVEALGFRRWRYEKMAHFHAMAFRAVPHEDRLPPPTYVEERASKRKERREGDGTHTHTSARAHTHTHTYAPALVLLLLLCRESLQELDAMMARPNDAIFEDQ